MKKGPGTTTSFDSARKSPGPKTPEGKAAVAQNRIVHCLTGERVLLPGEDPDTFRRLSRSLFEEHQPAGPTEAFLVEQLVHNQLRLERIADMETAILADMACLGGRERTPAVRAAQYMVSQIGSLQAHQLLQRYDTSIRRAYHQALTQLRVTQNNRKRDAEARKKLFEKGEQSAMDQRSAEILQIPDPPTAQSTENESCDSNPSDSPADGLPGFDGGFDPPPDAA
jgi:hypothetical protein